MTEAFQSYLSEYTELRKSISDLLQKDAKQQKGEEKKATLRRVGRELDEADEIIEQMQLEAGTKARLSIQVRTSKAEIKSLRDQLLLESSVSDRDLLLSGSGPLHQAYEIDVDDSDLPSHLTTGKQRQRLLQGTAKIDRTSGRLDNAQRVAAESELVGTEVLGSLRHQGGQLREARDELDTAELNVGKATGTLKKMVRQAFKNKALIYAFITVLVLIIILVLWSKFR